MIKILFFVDTGLTGGGAERVLCNLANALDPERFQVTVMTLWPQDSAPYLKPHVAYRSAYPTKNAFTQNLYRLEAATGTAWRRLGSGYDLEIAYLEAGPTKVLASSRSGTKKLAWVHSDLRLRPDSAAFTEKSAGWYPQFDRVVCVSENVRESFAALYGQTPPTAVLYNINDETEIREKADAFAPEHSGLPTLCALGRLSPEKGFDLLIPVCARLKEDGIPFRLQILGDGPERSALEAQIREHQLEEQVQLLGFRDNPYPYIKAADLIVCSSRYEGFSTVITESLILGRPVITTPCAGMVELLGDSEYGMITDDLYQGLKQMLTRPGLLAHYESQAALRGRDFQKENLVRKTEEFFLALPEGNKYP